MKIQSHFAVLNVKQGRKELLKQLEQAAGMGIPVTVTGFIADPLGSDNGESQEFAIAVVQVELLS